MSFLTFGSVAIPSVAYPGRVVKLPPYVSKGRVELQMWPLPHTGSRVVSLARLSRGKRVW